LAVSYAAAAAPSLAPYFLVDAADVAFLELTCFHSVPAAAGCLVLRHGAPAPLSWASSSSFYVSLAAVNPMSRALRDLLTFVPFYIHSSNN